MNTTLLPTQIKKIDHTQTAKKAKLTAMLSLFIILLTTGFSSMQAFAQTVLINPASPWVVPQGVTSIKVEAWGGGGAGGGSQNTLFTNRFGGGGGGGGFSVSTFVVTAGQSYTISTGAGGVAASNANGGNGGSTLVSGPGGAVSAGGGAGGLKSTGANGGVGGTGNLFSGGAGGTGTSNGAGGGGGAGNGGSGTAGTNTAAGTGGTGVPNAAPYKGGNGGASQNSATNDGNDGVAPAGGGGGGKSYTATSAGGDGAPGQVVITYTCPGTPTAFTVGGGGTYCSGGTGVSVTVSSSQLGINYQLFRGATALGILPGTGAALSFTNNTTAGTYTVVATNATTSCQTTMTGSAVVAVNASPSITSVVASPATICSGSISTITATAPLSTAATISLGSGASVTTGTSTGTALGPNPLEDFYGGAKQHILITAAELTAMGFVNGSQISALQIQLSTANTGYTLLNYSVRIQHTAVNALTTTFVTTGFTSVFGPVSYTPTGTGYNNIAFTTNFTWNGTSNLLIETSYSNNNAGSSGTTTAVFGTTAFVSTAFYRVDNATAAAVLAQTAANTTYSARNNIKLTGTVLPAITWTPVTQLFSNAGATTAYTAGQNFRTVYSKSTVTRTYTATATNTVGCTATSPVTVTVNDPVVIITQPVNQVVCAGNSISFSVSATGTALTYQWRKGTTNLTNTGNISGANSATLTIDPVVTGDAATTYNVIVNGTAPCTPVTSNNVTLTVNTAPGIICPVNATVNTDPGVCSATKTYSATVTGTPAPVVSYSISGTAITFPYTFPLGTTTVDVVAQNLCAPNAQCSFTVTVEDNEAPAIPVLGNATGQCSVTVTPPTANDACEGPITGTTADPLTYTTQGTFTINWSYADSQGNISTQSQTVIVDDITAPVPDAAPLPDISSECSVTLVAPTATDACVGSVTGTTTSPTTINTAGSYTITWSYNDGNGNISTQNQAVVVTDVNAPVPDANSLPDLTGECTITATPPTATDACVGTVTGTTTNPTTYNAAGSYTILWSYNDGQGNVSTQSQNVTVTDVNAPVPDVASLPTATGECLVTVTAPTATDACVGAVTGTTTDPTTYNTQGTFTINWIYNDGQGNTSSQIQTVIVDDITAPVANVATLPNATGECSVTVTSPTATDNCVGLVIGTTTDPVFYNNQGTYTINWIYDDGNGNTSTQSQSVVVDDITAPVADAASLPNATGECSVSVTGAPTATDACVGSVTGTTTDPLTYNTQGSFIINWTYDDGNGNTSSQTQTVIVDDITAPVADAESLPNLTGECLVTVTTVPTATDNCVGAVTGTTTDPLTYNTQGTFTINWVYNDNNGNTSSQAQTVIVDDITAPVADVASLPTATGECSVTVTAPTATDNCVGSVTGATTDPTTYNAAGNYTIVWSYDDGNGNVSTQSQNVTVTDVNAPVADIASLPNATGECTVTVTVPTATDACVGAVTGTTTDPLTYNTQGTFTITWTYNDGNGNTSSQTQTVIVDDVTAPVADLASLPNATGECFVTVTAPTATDVCVGSVTGTTTDPLTYNTQGSFTIAWIYDDGNGNTSSQTQTVIVDDVTAPVADVASLPTITGECSATVPAAPTATDNCEGSITGTTTDPLTYNTQGTFTITWNYNDGNGNSSSQIQTVIIDDVTAPVADVASLPTVTGECSASVTVAPTATDNCVGSVTGTTTDPLTYNTQGTFTITWNYNDGNGNSSSQTQTVVVDDVTAPVADVASLPTVTGECSATVSAAPTATDNCEGSITGTTTDPLTYNTQGTFTITWTYNDGNGNTSSQTQAVVVDDITEPVADVASLPNATGECSVTATAPTATDACVGSVTGTTTDPVTYNTQGTFTITWTYDDTNGNTSSQTQTVVVNDITAPVADAASLPTVTGECSATVSLAPTATDACVGSVTGTTTDPLTYNTQGTFTVTWTYDDGNGNTSLQTQTVVVDDVTAPVADVASLPNATGECSVTVSTPTATDACVGSVTGTTTDAVTYNTQGTFTITWTYNDGNGNTSTQSQTVIVNDITAPVISCPPAQTLCSSTGSNYTIPLLAASDNCGINTITYQVTGATTRNGIGNNASGIFNTGVSTIAWTVTDFNNNAQTCSTTVTINLPATTPGPLSGPINVCPYIGTGTELTYSVPAQSGATFSWIVPVTVTIVSGQGTNSIVVRVENGFQTTGNKQIRITALSPCGNSAQAVFVLVAQLPGTPKPITGPTNICALIGTTTQATYTIPKVTAATNYIWTTGQGTTVVHPYGTAENDTTILVTFDNNYVTSAITVRAQNSCGISQARSFNVPRNNPGTPGLISGPTNACPYILPNGTIATYSIAALAGATSYTWTAPAGSLVTHVNPPGANDISIRVQFPNGFTSGSISVTPINGCGTGSARTLAIGKLNPATPGVIDVIQTAACPNRQYTYTLSSMPANATSVQWTIPQGAILVSGQGSTSITVGYPGTAINSSVTAQGINNCGSSVIRQSVVKLAACAEPPAPFARSNGNGQTKKALLNVAEDIDAFKLSVYPNPTVNDFKVRLITAGKEIIHIRILDMNGRELKKTTLMPYQTITVGNELKAGAYLIEVIQGENKRTEKLLKF